MSSLNRRICISSPLVALRALRGRPSKRRHDCERPPRVWSAAPLCIGRSSGMRVHRPFKRHARHQGAHFQLAGRSSGACLIRLAAGTWHVLACRGVQRASYLHLASGDLLRSQVPRKPAPFARGLCYFASLLRSIACQPRSHGDCLFASFRGCQPRSRGYCFGCLWQPRSRGYCSGCVVLARSIRASLPREAGAILLCFAFAHSRAGTGCFVLTRSAAGIRVAHAIVFWRDATTSIFVVGTETRGKSSVGVYVPGRWCEWRMTVDTVVVPVLTSGSP